MQNFQIVITDDIVIHSNASTMIDSVFYLRTENNVFPHEDWTDFSYPLLNMWCEDLMRMSPDQHEVCILPFMDGPYWLEVKRDGALYSFQGCSSRNDFKAGFAFRCSLEQFLLEILASYRRLVEILFQNNQVCSSVRVEVKRSFQHYKKLIAPTIAIGECYE